MIRIFTFYHQVSTTDSMEGPYVDVVGKNGTGGVRPLRRLRSNI